MLEHERAQEPASEGERPEDNQFSRELTTVVTHLRRYARTLTRQKCDQDDLVQTALAKAWSKRSFFQYQGENSLRQWVMTMMHNEFVNKCRRDSKRPHGNSASTEDSDRALDYLRATDDPTIGLEVDDVARALGKLPAHHREVIRLIGYHGHKYEVVAERLGVPIGTVRSRFSRGREALRVLVGD